MGMKALYSLPGDWWLHSRPTSVSVKMSGGILYSLLTYITLYPVFGLQFDVLKISDVPFPFYNRYAASAFNV